MVEQLPVKELVVGPNPTSGANLRKDPKKKDLFMIYKIILSIKPERFILALIKNILK